MHLDTWGIGNHYWYHLTKSSREDGSAYKVDSIEEYGFWNNEEFWFDDNMDFIIYLSHEETITFGGKHIVKKVKSYWQERVEYLKWDTKNK